MRGRGQWGTTKGGEQILRHSFYLFHLPDPTFTFQKRPKYTAPSNLLSNMTIQNWQIQAQKGKDLLERSVPKQWLVPADQLPPVTQKNVTDFPRKSGLLTDRELGITELSATELTSGMGKGELTAEEVVVAFLKRSVLGHQLVRMTILSG
jgi:hypothetical protein